MTKLLYFQKISLLFFFSFFITPKIFALDVDTDSEVEYLLNLDLDELHLINFTSLSSKIEESISDIGGSITIYSSSDLKRYNYYNLGDLADITPGYSSHIRFGERVFETRGQKASSFNNDRHLLLVDGIPVHHARNYKVPTENELPLFFANKVEFLRGPASSLYGTSAFFGVVKLTPFESFEEGVTVQGRASGSTLDGQASGQINAFYNSDFGKTTLSFGYFNKHSSEDYIGVLNDPGWLNYDEQESQFVFFKHKIDQGIAEGLSLGLIYSRKKGGLGEFWLDGGSHPSNELIWETVVPFVKYEKEILDRLQFSAYIKHNRSREAGNVEVVNSEPTLRQEYESIVEDYEVQAELFFKYSAKTSLIFGVNFDSRRELGFPSSSSFLEQANGNQIRDFSFLPETSSWFETLAGYTQVRHEYDFLKGTIITAGARYTLSEFENQKNSDFSPRISITQRITDSFNLKFHYGTAFRLPGIKEIGFNKEKNVDFSHLKSEEFETLEFSLVYYKPHLLMEVALFFNRTSNAIDFEPERKFINLNGKTSSIGGELIVKYDFRNGLDFNFNYSYANSEDPEGYEINDIPIHKINLITNYSDRIAGYPYQVSLINRWVNGYSDADGHNAPSGFYIMDMNIGLQTYKYAKLGIQVRNFWDNHYKIPNNGQPEIPMPRRAIIGIISFDF